MRHVFVLSLLVLGGCMRFADKPERWSCDTVDDCESGEKCAGNGQCYPAWYCDGTSYSGLSCEGGFHCEESRCVENECNEDVDCPDNFACDTYYDSTFTCYTDCEGDDGKCASGFYCAASQCAQDCNPNAIGIASECADDELCDENGRCQRVPVDCYSDSECAPYVCDSYEEVCKTSCSGDWDCTGDYECQNNECVPPSCESTGCDAGYVCNAESVCEFVGCEGLTCGAYACDEVNYQCFYGCTRDDQCSGGHRCSSNGTCIASTVLLDGNCYEDAECVEGICDYYNSCSPKLSNTEPCTRNEQCSSNYCDTYYYSCQAFTCSYDWECPTACENGSCT